MKEIKMIPIELIEPNPYQPRIEFDQEALMELAQSIRENGLIQPISVRFNDGKYQIIAGERRYRALRLNGAIEVPANVMDADELQMAELALIENIQREELSAIEEAKSYLEIMRVSGLNQSQLALKLGKSQGAIANKIRLLQLNDEVQEAVSSHRISERHARALLSLDTQQQSDALQQIEKKHMTVVATERLVKNTLHPKIEKPKAFSKGISKSIRIAMNTLHQAVKMIGRSGCEATISEEELEEEVVITIRLPK